MDTYIQENSNLANIMGKEYLLGMETNIQESSKMANIMGKEYLFRKM